VNDNENSKSSTVRSSVIGENDKIHAGGRYCSHCSGFDLWSDDVLNGCPKRGS